MWTGRIILRLLLRGGDNYHQRLCIDQVAYIVLKNRNWGWSGSRCNQPWSRPWRWRYCWFRCRCWCGRGFTLKKAGVSSESEQQDYDSDCRQQDYSTPWAQPGRRGSVLFAGGGAFDSAALGCFGGWFSAENASQDLVSARTCMAYLTPPSLA